MELTKIISIKTGNSKVNKVFHFVIISSLLFMFCCSRSEEINRESNSQATSNRQNMKDSLHSTCQIEGVVYDLETKKKISNAFVVIDKLDIGAETDSNGHFNFEYSKPGEYTITAGKGGYWRTKISQVRLSKNKCAILKIPLFIEAIPMEPQPIEWEPSYK